MASAHSPPRFTPKTVGQGMNTASARFSPLRLKCLRSGYADRCQSLNHECRATNTSENITASNTPTLSTAETCPGH